MKKNLLLLIFSIGLAFYGAASQATNSCKSEKSMHSVTIGTTEQFQHPEAFRMPFDFHWQSSLSQTLYYPQEIGMDRGILGGLTYYTNFQENLQNKPIQIWVGETQTPNVYNGWIDPQTLTLVFDGTINFPSGDNTIDIIFDTPYEYNGGILVVYSHRVWETNYHGWGNRFYTTETPGLFRTRQANEDNNSLDPLNPTLNGNWRVGWYPTITLNFPLQFLANIEGNVSNNGEPLEGVSVTILGTSASTLTDHNGDFALTNIMADTYDIQFSKQGFHTHVEEDLTLQGGQTTLLNVSMNEVERFDVSGVIQGNDGVGLQNALIILEGLSSYQVSSGNNGDFIIEDVFEGNYTLTVIADGFEAYQNVNIIVAGSDLDLGLITLIEIILTPLGLTATVDISNPGDVILSWYHDTTSEFRYDEGFQFWIGVQGGNEHMVFGTVFRHYAVLSELAWYLSSEMQQHPTVTLWLFGLDETGQPDRELLLWSAAGVTNTDDQWNVFDLGAGVVAENGFLFGISAPGGAFLGVDDGESQQWPFRQNTHFFTANINEEAFAAIETISNLTFNFNLRAMGIDNGEIHFDGDELPKQSWQETNFIVATQKAQPVINLERFAGKASAKINNRALTGYNIFLNDLEIPFGFSTERFYTLTNLEEGNYTAGVQAAYTSGTSEIILADFFTEGSTSIISVSDDSYKVYPNPFSQQINILFPREGKFTATVYDLTGRVLVTVESGSAFAVIAAESWLPGVYWLVIRNNEGKVFTRKIIKQ